MERHIPKLITAATATITVMLVGAFVLLAGLVTSAQTARGGQTELTGNWLLKMAEGPHGPTEMPMAIKQEGTAVTAELTPPGNNGTFIMTGEFAKGALTLAVGEGDQGFLLKATLQADGTLKGYLSSSMGDATWTAARVKS